jgi:hypothetical protein
MREKNDSSVAFADDDTQPGKTNVGRKVKGLPTTVTRIHVETLELIEFLQHQYGEDSVADFLTNRVKPFLEAMVSDAMDFANKRAAAFKKRKVGKKNGDD